MHAEQRLESETLKWLGKLQERVKGLPKASDSKVAAELENVHAYLKDCQHFLDRKDYVNAFEAVIYAWGILETMERMGLLEQDGKRAGTGMPDKGRKLEEEAAGKAKEAQEANDRLKYLQADFDNYRKHFEKERQSVIELASAGVITELLPLLDELALTAQHARDQNDREGIKLLDEKLIKVLGKYGLKQIETEGKRFDPAFHEAIAQEASAKPDGTILETYQPGYALKSKVLRPAKVKVAGGNGNG